MYRTPINICSLIVFSRWKDTVINLEKKPIYKSHFEGIYIYSLIQITSSHSDSFRSTTHPPQSSWLHSRNDANSSASPLTRIRPSALAASTSSCRLQSSTNVSSSIATVAFGAAPPSDGAPSTSCSASKSIVHCWSLLSWISTRPEHLRGPAGSTAAKRARIRSSTSATLMLLMWCSIGRRNVNDCDFGGWRRLQLDCECDVQRVAGFYTLASTQYRSTNVHTTAISHQPHVRDHSNQIDQYFIRA